MTKYSLHKRMMQFASQGLVVSLLASCVVFQPAFVAANTTGTEHPKAELSHQLTELITAKVLENTGDYFANRVTVTQNSESTTSTQNQADIDQQLTTVANTGNNEASRNISIGGSAGVISTGQAGIGINYVVAANNSVALIGGEVGQDGPGSGASIVRANSGKYSVFNFHSAQDHVATAATANAAEIQQACGTTNQPCQATTGHNTTNRNISIGGDAGVISTGAALIDIVLFTLGNSATTTTSL